MAEPRHPGSPLSDEERDAFYERVYLPSTRVYQGEQRAMAEAGAFEVLARLRSSDRVLDLASGFGRNLLPLSRVARAFGVDRSSAAVAATPLAVRAGCARGDLRALPFRSGAFDAVASFYSSLFFFDEEGNLAALREAARVLKPGGCFFFHSSNPVQLARQPEATFSAAMPGGGHVRERCRFHRDIGREVGHRHVRLPDGTESEGRFSVRIYAPGELEVLANRAGLKVTRVYGSIALEPYRRDSPEVVAVMVKAPKETPPA